MCQKAGLADRSRHEAVIECIKNGINKREDVAPYVNIKPQTLTNIFSDLKREGKILWSADSKSWRIVDHEECMPDRLRLMMGVTPSSYSKRSKGKVYLNLSITS